MSEREEVLLETCYVLHQRPYRNTSLIVDCLTLNHGRIGLVAQAARRPGGGLNSLLQPFRRIRVSWVRRGELGRLTGVESDAIAHAIEGDALISAYYLNELLLRLVPSGDHNDRILNCYSHCLGRLAEDQTPARALRLFELELLDELGYHVDLEQDFRTGEPIRPEQEYVFEHEGGMTISTETLTMETFEGDDLISLREHRLDNSKSLKAAKRLLARILDFHLGDRPLRTRMVMRQIFDRGLGS